MASTDNSVVLGYWKIRGLGHPIRFLLNYLGVEFEDKYYEFTPEQTKDYWYADRDKLKLAFPNLPYLLDGSARVTETRAILKYLCRTRKPDLLGKDVPTQTMMDTVDNFLYDLLYVNLIPVVYQYTEELRKNYKEIEPVKLGYLSKNLGDNPWITGKDITYVDFFAYEVLHHIRTFDNKALDKFPNLQAYLKRFEELPQIKKYMASPKFLKAPCYTIKAAYQM